MEVALILFVGGVVVVAWIFFWVRLPRETYNEGEGDVEQLLKDVPLTSNGEAVLVSRDHGQLIYVNPSARTMLGMNGGEPNLEQLARAAQPAESFLELFAGEGQSAFQLGARWVSASSHRIPSGNETRTVVIMRELSGTTSSPDMLDLSKAMMLINQIGETVDASLGVEQTLQSLLSLIRQAIPFDAAEINLKDDETEAFAPRGWSGDPTYLISLAEMGGAYKSNEGITGWIARHKQPLLVTDRNGTGIQPKVPSSPYLCIMGVPLLLGDNLIGSLELASTTPHKFTQNDFALLQAVSNPATVAIYNATLYAEQVRRIEDITTLQQTIDQEFETTSAEAIFAILTERITKLTGTRMAGIYLYDETRKGLAPVLPFYGIPDPVIRNQFIPLPANSPQHDIWSRQSYWISNDVRDEPLAEVLGLNTLVNLGGLQNTAWLPLQIGSRRIGMMAVYNKRGGGFTPRDIINLRALASQASIVVENVQLAEREETLDAQLAGLQEITYAIGAITQESQFFTEITQRIATLMNIEMCGILLFDEANHRLVSRLPFVGIRDDLVRDYAIDVTPGTVFEELWSDEEFWYSNHIQTEALTFAAGMEELARTANVQKTLFAVMATGGRKVGVVQVSNKRNGQDFTDSDARLLLIFGSQAAAIMENARLFQEVQHQSETAQQLRRIAEMAGTIATTEDALRDLLAEIAGVTESSLVFVNVLSQTGSVITYPRWLFGVELSEPIVQDAYAPGFENSVIEARRPFISNNVIDDLRVLPSYRQLATKFNISHAIIVPLIIGERVLGELGIANRPNRGYTEDDLQQLTAIATQISAALDRLLIYQATGENLNRRLEELDAISRISNELTLTLDFDQILNTIRKEALNATGATGATVALLHPIDRWASPDRPSMDRRLGNARVMTKLADIELEAISRGADSVVVHDYQDSEYEASPPEARSGLAATILYVDQIVGVLHLYHDDPNHFDDQSAAFALTLAAKASLGYGNSVRFQEQIERSERLRRRVEQLNRIFELGHMLPSSTEPMMVLEAVAYSVQQAVGFDLILMLLVDEEAGVLRRVTHAGLPIDVFEKTKDHTISLNTINQLFEKTEYMVSESYFLPTESATDWYNLELGNLITPYDGKRTIDFSGKQSWHDGDILMVPIRGATGSLLGIMSLDRPQDNKRPDRTTVEVLEIFAHQASTTLENTRLYHASVRSTEQETRLNEMMEAVSSTLEVGRIAELVAQGMIRLMPFSRMTLALLDNEGKGFDVVRATVQPGSNTVEISRDRRISLARTALGRSYIERTEFIYRASDDPRLDFEDLKDWHELGEKIGIVLPLITGGECLGAMHIGSDRPDTRLFTESQSLLKRMAQLIAASVQNARLYNQAVGLQVLNESVVESIQQGIIVLNNSGKMISINQYMRQRYGWTDDAIGQDLFTFYAELAPLISRDMRFVLENGVPQERLNQMTVGDQNELLVRNFYIYPLRYDDSVRGAVLLIEDVTERAQMEEAMEARANQLAALTEVSTRITSSLEREEVITLSLEEMALLIRYKIMTHWRRNGSYMVLEGYAGTDTIDPSGETRIRINDFDRVRQMVDSQRVTVINSKTPLTDNLPGESDVRSWMGVPLVNQGHVVGMFVLTQPFANAYESKSDQNIAFAFASQVAIALANADLFEQTFDRTNELGTLLEAAQATSATQDIDQIFRTVTELMLSALEMDQCTILIWDEVDNNLEVQIDVSHNTSKPERIKSPGTRFEVGSNSGKLFALREREVVVITQEDSETPYPEESAALLSEEIAARMFVPLVARDGSIGLLQLDQYSGDRVVMTQQKVRLARALGSQVAVAIQNARLQAEMASMFNEALIINDLSRAISSKLNVDDMIGIVRDQVPAVTQSDELYLALYDEATENITFPLAVRSGTQYTIPPRKLGTDEVSFIIRHGRYLSLGADYFSPDDLRKSLNITNGEGDARSYLGVPLKAGDKVFGVLALRDTQRTRAFTINDQRILETVGSQLGAAVQNAQLFARVNNLNLNLNQLVEDRTRELEEERDRLDTLYQITSELARTLDMERLQQQAIGMVAKAVGAEDGVIFGLDPLTDALYTQAYMNPNTVTDSDDGEHKLHPAESLASWLIQNAADDPSIVIEDLHSFEHWDMSAPGAIRWRSAVAVVLESNQNDPQGVMVMLNSKVDNFGESELRLLVAAANQVASSINNADLYHLIRDQAERLGTLLRAEQEEAEKNSAILESIADGVILSDADGKVILFNTAAERILSLPREQVLGQPLSKFTGLYGSEVAAWAQAIQDRTARAELEMQGEFVNDRLSLGEKIVSAHLSPVYTGERLLGMVSVFRDITRDVEVDRMKSEFIANVSHEFRTPLTTVKGYNDLIMMGAMGELNDMQKMAMGKVKENVDRLTVLVEDVLDISKIDSGRERLRIEEIHIENTIASVLESLLARPNHQRKELAVSTEFEPGLSIQADRGKINRVLSNIIDNAFNYTPSGGKVDIRAKLQTDANRVLISIADTGVGIPDSFRDDVWKRFQRYEEHALTLDVAGTGLGLSIVKEMVEMHGGEVWFESEVGKGTTFFISLPVEPPDYIKHRTSTDTFRQVKED